MTQLIMTQFIVTRTSIWSKDVQPCNEAKQIEVVRVDRRSAGDPKEIPYYKGTSGWWYSRGSNHRVDQHGYICRDMGTELIWVVQLDTLDDLLAFTARYGPCIVKENLDGNFELEIYDGYRE